MPEGESKDDLFEDLDKFFAPIQDVDWPETTSPAEPGGEAKAGVEGHAPAAEPAEGAEDERLQDLLGPAEPAVAGPAASRVEPPEVSGGDEVPGAGGDLVDSLSQPPSVYVDLPDTVEDEAELDEGPAEEPPSAEAVEAAAEHFAESVRDEVEITAEPGAGEPRFDTEPFGPGSAPEDLPEPETLLSPEPSVPRTVRVGGEGLGGPSWQEPTTVEVGVSEDRRPSGRDVPAAFLTGLVLAGLAVGSIAIAPAAFAIVAGAIVLWAQGELYRALQKAHQQPATALGLVAGGLILAAGYFRGEAAMLSVFVVSVFASFLWYMASPPAHRRGSTMNLALTVLGIAYVPLLAAYAFAMLNLPSDGRALVLSVIGLTFAYDTAAFVVGSWWGSRALAPNISPKKSVEGAIGATLVVIAVSVGLVASTVGVLNTPARSVGLAVVVAVFAPLGDLAESLLKRDLGLKDMGSVLPGHGGVLDRIDSVLFAIPAAFLFLRLILG